MAAMVNIHDAKTHFSRLIERVRLGEEIVIAKAASRWLGSCRKDAGIDHASRAPGRGRS